MSKRSKHQKAEFPAGGYSSGVAERLTPPPESAQSKSAAVIPVSDEARERGLAGLGYTYTWHDNEQDNGGAVAYATGQYKPLEQSDFVPTRVCTRREHELLQGRISNQRRELRHLNRAYRRREDENHRRIALLKDQLKVSIRATEARNLKIENQQREIDFLKARIAEMEGKRKRRRSGIRRFE